MSASSNRVAIRSAAVVMVRQGRGHVVNISSLAGIAPVPGLTLYCASKFAVEGLVSALSQELPSGLAAVAVGPGVVHTDMLRQVRGQAAAECESPEAWSRRAAPFFLGLGPADNGGSVSVPS